MLHKFRVFQLAKQHHFICKQLTMPEVLKDQLFRASSSVALNIAEGSGRRTPKDQKKFYSIAFGSLRECQAVIELEDIKNEELISLQNQLGAILFKLTKKETVTETHKN